MLAVPPIIAEIAPGVIGIAVAIGGWFAAKHARNLGHKHQS